MAGTFRDREARIILSHMAQAWLRLGTGQFGGYLRDHCQDAKVVRPVVQQQQQIQPKQGK